MISNAPDWNGRPFYSFDCLMKERFGQKVYKLSLDAGCTCPNRDGTLGRGGCIFCSAEGAGEFAVPVRRPSEMQKQIEKAKAKVQSKSQARLFAAYFQSFTNTYGDTDRLSSLFHEAISHPDIAALFVGTRPDCLAEDKIRMLKTLNQIKPVWVELGLQTIHPKTADFIRRGYTLDVFDESVRRLKAAGLAVIVHLILGLPGESPEDMLKSVRYLANFPLPIDGIKLQLLHVQKGTDLHALYQRCPFPVFTLEEYVDFVITCVEYLPPSMVVHRLTGDGPKALLAAPIWSGSKKQVLNTFTRRFKERNSWQGKNYPC